VSEAFLEVRNARKSFGTTTVLDGVALGVDRGEFVSLLGPSGCGKTTLLRIIAGLAAADDGDVILDGQDIGHRPAHKRDVGVVFQNYALFPHLNVAENIAFGLKGRVSQAESARIAARFLAWQWHAPWLLRQSYCYWSNLLRRSTANCGRRCRLNLKGCSGNLAPQQFSSRMIRMKRWLCLIGSLL